MPKKIQINRICHVTDDHPDAWQTFLLVQKPAIIDRMYIFKSQSTQRERVTRGACHRRPAKCEKAINLSTHAHRGLHALDMWNMVCWYSTIRYRFYGVIFKIIPHNCVYSASDVCDFCTACRLDAYSSSFVKWQLIEKKERIIKQEMSHGK